MRVHAQKCILGPRIIFGTSWMVEGGFHLHTCRRWLNMMWVVCVWQRDDDVFAKICSLCVDFCKTTNTCTHQLVFHTNLINLHVCNCSVNELKSLKSLQRLFTWTTKTIWLKGVQRWDCRAKGGYLMRFLLPTNLIVKSKHKEAGEGEQGSRQSQLAQEGEHNHFYIR